MNFLCLFIFIIASQFYFGQTDVYENLDVDIELSDDQMDVAGDDYSEICLDQDDSEETLDYTFDSKVDFFGNTLHEYMQEDFLSIYSSDHFSPPDMV
jgi:hypothetical protein